MAYSEDQAAHLSDQQHAVVRELQELFLQIVVQGESATNARVREHLLHGAARRVGVIKRCIENVYTLFPPGASRPLHEDKLADVQINLHAFVMNLYGIYDNWAWAYILRHDLEEEIGGRRRIGLFIEATQKRLPTALRNYLSSTATSEWYEKYVKSFRDALAHRIPLYIPPAQFTPDEGEQYNRLEAEKVECITAMRWERLDQIWSEQTAIGVPCFTFLHAFSEDDPPSPILLHPQMLSDARSIVEFGMLFLKHWHENT
jgi:hypothetical protein